MKTLFKILTVMTLIAINQSAISQENFRTIKVKGTGKVVVQSNQGEISANVVTKDLSADVAIANNGIQVQSVVNALLVVGIGSNDIETTRFSFRPEYKWDDGEYIFDGYSVSSGLSITVTDNSIMGPVLDLIVDAGVTRINNVSFSSVDIEELKQQALINATNDAKSKAQILAAASNVTLGNAIKITNTGNSSQFFNGGAVASSPPPPGVNGTVILPGTNNITTTVTIEYLIMSSE
jgi:uncharacterized protein YggE